MDNLTNIKLIKTAYSKVKSDILVIGAFENLKNNQQIKEINKQLDGKLIKAIEIENFNGKIKSQLLVHGNNKNKRILILGLGKKNNYATDRARSISADLSKYANSLKLKTLVIDGDSLGLNKTDITEAFIEGLVLGTYSFENYKTKDKGKQVLKNIEICGNVDIKSIEKGKVLGKAVSFARDLGNHPANILTPSFISKEAQRIADKTKDMNCSIFEMKDIKKMGMGAFYGVAQGAKEPAKMIIVEYNGGPLKQKPVALVGKGLTFDSGGISLKPSSNMDEMKFDMCGSATVMGVLDAVSQLKPKLNIIFAIGSTENMPGSNAQRPGDIVTAYNGKTIEVLNTDAEGRLVLADVLAYVNKKYKPAAILDFATLTGAVLIALGNRASGVMGNDKKLMNEIFSASKLSNEKVWELPMWEEYTREIKGKYADLKNIGDGRLAGTITAGAFLKEFVDKTPWVHMDIAGTAWGPKEPSYQPKVGATGVGVRLVWHYLNNYK